MSATFARFTSIQDLMYDLIYSDDPEVELTPSPASTQPDHPLDHLWSIIYSSEFQTKGTLPETIQLQSPPLTPPQSQFTVLASIQPNTTQLIPTQSQPTLHTSSEPQSTPSSSAQPQGTFPTPLQFQPSQPSSTPPNPTPFASSPPYSTPLPPTLPLVTQPSSTQPKSTLPTVTQPQDTGHVSVQPPSTPAASAQSHSTPPTSIQSQTTPSTYTQSKPSRDSNHTEAKPVIETITSSSHPPLFSLIIGIDKYKNPSIIELGGAVADAKAVKSYLENSLGVPESQIKTLTDGEATRDAIIRSLLALKSDPRIQKDDPILIFYAGHGTTAKAPPNWAAGSDEIQILLSYDAQSEDNGRMIYGLPDRTMGILLEQIAKEKGNNITVIFDCCHSGSLTRGMGSRVRGVHLTMNVPHDLDKEILGAINTGTLPTTRGTPSQAKFLNSGLGSHVLLAACGEKETAKEHSAENRGEFTRALLDTLISVGADKVTYTELIQRLPVLNDQSPQCEGHNRDRILFQSKAPSQRRKLYAVRVKKDKCILDAGRAHGITKGATFDIYKNREGIEKEAPLATLIASEQPGIFSTVLSGDGSKVSKQAFALQTGAGAEEDLLVHVAMDSKLESVFRALAKEMKEDTTGRQHIRVVDEDQISTAHLDIAFENGKIVFNILNPLVTAHGLKRMPFQLNPTVEDVRPVLRAAAYFHWHLRRSGKSKVLRDAVEIEFTRLQDKVEEHDDEEYDGDEGVNGRSPDGPNLIHDGIVDIIVDENDENMYGMTLKNTSNDPLYASIFYFDNSNFSITSYFQPPTSGGRVDPPLLPRQALPIGYGGGGSPPITYSLESGQDIDVGFIKIFISTEPIDLSVVPQGSPFRENGRGVGKLKDKPNGSWKTVLITVVQRQKASL
ncbi:hypothetical protein M408DRAFT_25142 [Serendipita vermifera MAFF 305830]|uniref:Peptidase C14 caspase domain-containing protein n=1 Tax=Serendipita vermifera MAFF 305830 TaxID=933852 RepID=A0A0C3AQ17_SERVB|nr:hypothetical protein M408DRAFT_25142 [Serendipita vermifera MAFF 305830]